MCLNLFSMQKFSLFTRGNVSTYGEINETVFRAFVNAGDIGTENMTVSYNSITCFTYDFRG